MLYTVSKFCWINDFPVLYMSSAGLRVEITHGLDLHKGPKKNTIQRVTSDPSRIKSSKIKITI